MNKLTDYEIDILDHYVISNNLCRMNFVVFKHIVDRALPLWRSEQLCGELFVDDNGRSVYEQYINFTTDKQNINSNV